MLVHSMLHTNDDLEATDKYTGVYIIHKTHLDGEKSTVCSCPVSPSGHKNHNGAYILKMELFQSF